VKVDARWASEELNLAMAELTGQQARGVVRIVQAELNDEPVSSLLDNPNQMCTSTTYYGSGRRQGWRHKPEFQHALKLARRDYRAWLLEQSTSEALVLLANTAPDAVIALRQQIVGDVEALRALEEVLESGEPELRMSAAQQLGATELKAVSPALRRAYRREKDVEVKKALVIALGRVAGSTHVGRRAASKGTLDRGSVKTASKGTMAISDLDDVTEQELDAIEGALIQEAQGSGQAE